MISTLDLIIILSYFIVAIALGILVSKRAIKKLNSYFLGSNTLPWGRWKPILKKVRTVYPDFQPNRNFTHDLFNVFDWSTLADFSRHYPHRMSGTAAFDFYSCLEHYVDDVYRFKFTWWNQLDSASEEILPADFDQRIKVKALL
jgi:hypothetical protein